MDEVGRGTTVKDGLAISFATVHHLATVNQCRVLFATHFHELSDLLGCSENATGQGAFDSVSFFRTDVDETNVSSSGSFPVPVIDFFTRTGILPTPTACGLA